jgi:hypothetical protein
VCGELASKDEVLRDVAESVLVAIGVLGKEHIATLIEQLCHSEVQGAEMHAYSRIFRTWIGCHPDGVQELARRSSAASCIQSEASPTSEKYDMVVVVLSEALRDCEHLGGPAFVRILEDTDGNRTLALRMIESIDVCDRDCMRSIARCLEDTNADLRATAAAALYKVGDPTVSQLPEVLKAARDSDAIIRLTALNIIGKWQPIREDGVAVLMEAISDEDASVRKCAVKLLSTAAMGSGTASIICQQMKHEESRMVIEMCLRALGGVDVADTETTQCILEVFSGARGRMRDIAAVTLAKRGYYSDEVCSALRKAQESPDYRIEGEAKKLIESCAGQKK